MKLKMQTVSPFTQANIAEADDNIVAFNLHAELIMFNPDYEDFCCAVATKEARKALEKVSCNLNS